MYMRTHTHTPHVSKYHTHLINLHLHIHRVSPAKKYIKTLLVALVIRFLDCTFVDREKLAQESIIILNWLTFLFLRLTIFSREITIKILIIKHLLAKQICQTSNPLTSAVPTKDTSFFI